MAPCSSEISDGLIVWGVALIRLRFMGPVFGDRKWPHFWTHPMVWNISQQLKRGLKLHSLKYRVNMSPYVSICHMLYLSAPLQRPRNSSHQICKVRCQVCAVNDVHGKARKPEALGWPVMALSKTRWQWRNHCCGKGTNCHNIFWVVIK